MTFAEAFKIGRPMKRKSMSTYTRYDVLAQMAVADFMMDDWEVEPISVTITDKQYYEMVAEATKEYHADRYAFGGLVYTGTYGQAAYDMVDRLATKLGFKK